MLNRQQWISHRAYTLWKEAGQPQGQDLDFWLYAEEAWQHHLKTLLSVELTFGDRFMLAMEVHVHKHARLDYAHEGELEVLVLEAVAACSLKEVHHHYGSDS